MPNSHQFNEKIGRFRPWIGRGCRFSWDRPIPVWGGIHCRLSRVFFVPLGGLLGVGVFGLIGCFGFASPVLMDIPTTLSDE